MANVEATPTTTHLEQNLKDREQLDSFEKFWVSIQPLLLSRGYQLRSRYHPGWTPSWLQPGGKPLHLCDDSLPTGYKMIDATRINDNSKVVIRQVPTKTVELPLLMRLSPVLQADPRNCTVPILDIIILPGNDELALIVMPMLRDFANLTFRRVGEVVEMFEQLVHFLAFLHEQNISHMDFCWYNIMMDGSRVVPKGWHFFDQFSHDGNCLSDFEWLDRWSVRPVKYYVIDFELSQCFKSKENARRLVGQWGQDRSVPEMSFTSPSDPFEVDVYQLGNVVKKLIRESGNSPNERLVSYREAFDTWFRGELMKFPAETRPYVPALFVFAGDFHEDFLAMWEVFISKVDVQQRIQHPVECGWFWHHFNCLAARKLARMRSG